MTHIAQNMSELMLPVFQAAMPHMVLGADVVAEEFLLAALRHGHFDSINLIYKFTNQAGFTERPSDVVRLTAGTPIRTTPLRDLVRGRTAISGDVWHDIRPRGESFCQKVCNQRQAARRSRVLGVTRTPSR